MLASAGAFAPADVAAGHLPYGHGIALAVTDVAQAAGEAAMAFCIDCTGPRVLMSGRGRLGWHLP